MVEGLVNLSGTNQNLINFDEAINLILSLKRYIVVKTKKIKNEIFNRHEAIENMYCYFLDFDKEKE